MFPPSLATACNRLSGFATGGVVFRSGPSLAMSLLASPLSDEDAKVNMAVPTLVPRFRTVPQQLTTG
ncbi:MAG: hypothetical protein WBX25_24570 [Rhodomicrobium sp.]